MKTRLVAALLSLVLLVPAAFAAPQAPWGTRPPFTPDASLAPLKQKQQRLLLEKARAKLERGRAAWEAMKKKRRGPGAASRAPKLDAWDDMDRARRAPPFGAEGRFAALAALAPNVRVNNPAGDGATAGQAEAWIGVHGSNLLVAWNDGQGFDLASQDIQGYAWSTDGGATWTDGGIPAKRTGWRWTSDPVIAVNPTTGVFYYCALYDSANGAFNGVGVVTGQFNGPGGSFQWGTVYSARQVSSAVAFLDKQWIDVDPANGTVYVCYTNFNAGTGAQIDLVRFTGTFWSAPTKMNTSGDGLVQGARVAVGDDAGEVYCVWAEIGTVDVDFFRIRRSTTSGASWETVKSLPSYFANWGAGAPGFNRERGITFPSIAVDRNAASPYKGRVYVTWNEALNYYDEFNLAGTGQKSEVEPNGTSAQATPFTLGQTVRGAASAVSPSPDFDWFSFSGTQGQTVAFYMDSLHADLDPSFRIICSDATTLLSISNLGAGAGGLMVFTLPATGTYYLRVVPFSTTTGVAPWPYRIETRVIGAGPGDRARDHRDVFVTTSSGTATTWSTPVRINDEPGWFDDWLPEIAVAGNHQAYAIWYDWRDAPAGACGGHSNVYLSRSADGGATWIEVGAVTDQTTNWTSTASNIAPNQGDYLTLVADANAVYPVWADGRFGTADIFFSNIPLAVTPALASLVSAEALPDRVTLTWAATDAAGHSATVYRRDAGADWRAMATTAFAGDGRLVHVDTDVVPGAAYDYRLGLREGGVETFAGETRVVVPAGPDLAIAAVRPNPTPRDVVVTFALPRAASASLELVDIGGRRVRTREVGSLGAGRHTVNLTEGTAALPAGVYIVALHAEGRTVTRRVSIVP
uniref:T9SS type A sorting domain-containing protein n=1 Tax=Eiseniibacteriota bacterium TaxID=2212470 RepID=A0A832I2I1_UNCEI